MFDLFLRLVYLECFTQVYRTPDRDVRDFREWMADWEDEFNRL